MIVTLSVHRCRRRHRGFTGRSDPCETDVEKCLDAKSGLAFIKGAQARAAGVGRSNDLPTGSADLEASKCKIDTILCGLDGGNGLVEVTEGQNATAACSHRIRKCLPLLNIESGPKLKADAGSGAQQWVACFNLGRV